MALYRLHKTTGDVDDAILYLDNLLDRYTLNNPSRRKDAHSHLRSYSRWLASGAMNPVETKLRISLPLGAGVILGGQIPRLDVDGSFTKYTGVLLGTSMPSLRHELRPPLLQRAIASAIHRPEEDVFLACQALDGSDLQELHFVHDDIDEAMSVAERLAYTLASL